MKLFDHATESPSALGRERTLPRMNMNSTREDPPRRLTLEDRTLLVHCKCQARSPRRAHACTSGQVPLPSVSSLQRCVRCGHVFPKLGVVRLRIAVFLTLMNFAAFRYVQGVAPLPKGADEFEENLHILAHIQRGGPQDFHANRIQRD